MSHYVAWGLYVDGRSCLVSQAEEDEEEVVVDTEQKPVLVIFEPGDVIGPLGGVLCRKKAGRPRPSPLWQCLESHILSCFVMFYIVLP